MNLKELSRHLNLSQTTVSRALNGYPEVSEATRQRVRDAARALNYSPNARAKSLATGRAMAIGHLLPVSKRNEMINPIFVDFIAGAAEIYAHQEYDMMVSLVEDGREAEHYSRFVARGTVDGLIVSGPRVCDPRLNLLDRLGLPYVVHGRVSGAKTPYSWVDTDNTGAFRRATEFLLDLGHRRIALINGNEDMDFAYRRRRGYEAALTARGLAIDPALIFSADMTEAYGNRTAKALLAQDTPPTAFLVASMVSAFGIRRAIQDAGLTVGRDLSIITHDDELGTFANDQTMPIFTATRCSARKAGMRVAEMLLDLIRNPGCAPQQDLLEAELVVGQSTGPASG